MSSLSLPDSIIFSNFNFSLLEYASRQRFLFSTSLIMLMSLLFSSCNSVDASFTFVSKCGHSYGKLLLAYFVSRSASFFFSNYSNVKFGQVYSCIYPGKLNYRKKLHSACGDWKFSLVTLILTKLL